MLERLASEAGCTRGALYGQFKDKEDLALALVGSVGETCNRGERLQGVLERVRRLIAAGRKAGSILAAPAAKVVAQALLGAIEGVVIELSGAPAHDERLAAAAALGVVGSDCGRGDG